MFKRLGLLDLYFGVCGVRELKEILKEIEGKLKTIKKGEIIITVPLNGKIQLETRTVSVYEKTK